MESGLGIMDYRSCSEASTNITSNRPKNYRKWSEKERYEIGKYAAIHGSRAAERKFHTKEKPLSESNAGRFSKLIYDAVKAGSSGLQSIDPFEDISPVLTEHDESESFLPATIDQLTNEFRENFVNVPFDEENSEWEQSDNEDDVDSERNIFDDIIIDDE